MSQLKRASRLYSLLHVAQAGRPNLIVMSGFLPIFARHLDVKICQQNLSLREYVDILYWFLMTRNAVIPRYSLTVNWSDYSTIRNQYGCHGGVLRSSADKEVPKTFN